MIKWVLQYSKTEAGREGLLTAAAIGSTTVAGGYVLLHTAFLDKYRNFVQLYKNGLTSNLTTDLTRRAEEVIDDLNLSTKSRAFIKFFYVQGFDTFHLGSLKTRSGAYVGIPGNFNYETKVDIERNLIVVDTKPVSWSSADGELLQHSIVLSENAQKFAIAREFCHLNTYYVYLYGGIPSLAISMQYLLAHFANIKFYGHYKPRGFRYTVYSLIAIFTFGVYSTAKDSLTRYYENWADEEASSLGLNYAKGAVELYTKLVQRNMALRELMGPRGESMYTKLGNYNELIRNRHLPPLIRKENAERRVRKYLDPPTTDTASNNNELKKDNINVA